MAVINRNLADLSGHELCYLWRKRNKLTQKKFCKVYDVTEAKLSEFERGVGLLDERLLWKYPPWKNFRPSAGELCRIARRRSGYRTNDLDTSGFAVQKRERNKGLTADLVKYWRKRGFKFPE